MKLFLPKDRAFFNYLTNSTHNLKNITSVLTDISTSYKNFSAHGKRAEKIEHDADQNVHEIIRWLNRAFITPFDREDIYLLVLEFDDVIDLMEEIIHMIGLFNLKTKPFFLGPFSKIAAESSLCLTELISSLESSTSGKERQETILKIHELEDRGDDLYDLALRKIFANSKNPLEVIKNKDICDKLEKLMDKFQKLSDVIESLLLKYG